jgi:hypothetical protein
MKKTKPNPRFAQKRPYTSHPTNFRSKTKLKKPLKTANTTKNLRQRKSTGRIYTISNKENSKSRYNSQRLNMNKKLRNAEADRKAYAEETVAIIKKQRTQLEFLQRENSVLKETLTQGLDKKFLLMGGNGGGGSGGGVGVKGKGQFDMDEDKLDEKYFKLINEEEKKLKKIQSNIKIFEKQIGRFFFDVM